MILITGFPGQDALTLAYACSFANIPVLVIAKKPTHYSQYCFNYIYSRFEKITIKYASDLTNDELHNLFKEHIEIRAVFHFASMSQPSLCAKHPLKALESNVFFTDKILSAVYHTNHAIKVGVASSIYAKCPGSSREEPISIHSPQSTSLDIYTTTKRMCNDLSHLYRSEGLDKISIYYFCNHESPLRNSDFIIPTLIKKIRDGESISIRRPYVVRDWQLNIDALLYIVLAMTSNAGTDFIVGSGISHSIANLANELCTLNGKSKIYSDEYDVHERDVVSIAMPHSLHSDVPIYKNQDQVTLMLECMNKYWGRIEDEDFMQWTTSTAAWEFLISHLEKL